MNELSEPVISIGFDFDPVNATYFAKATVSGFKTSGEAEACVNAMQKLLCGEEVAQVKS